MQGLAHFLIFIMMGLVGSIAAAQTTAISPTQAAPSIAAGQPSVTLPYSDQRASETEIAVLRARLEEEQTHNGAVLQTVYWSLGVLVTLAIALIGFGWFANFRVYERDKEALATALDAHVVTGLSNAMEVIRHGHEDLRQHVVQETERMKAESSSTIDNAVTARLAEIKAKLERTEQALKDTRLEHELLRAAYLFGQAQHGRAFSSCLSAIELARDLGRSHVVHSVLDEIEKQINKMDGVFASDIQTLTTFLTHLDGVNPIQLASLTETLRKVRKL
ncbi:hypothetical protein AYO43_09635 [Nitrospira sp. SCGC AG-212-E16]|nr:hypothetical protein AYO43_09635 [Nitrospira sp. SCGC AG-212-E16]